MVFVPCIRITAHAFNARLRRIQDEPGVVDLSVDSLQSGVQWCEVIDVEGPSILSFKSTFVSVRRRVVAPFISAGAATLFGVSSFLLCIAIVTLDVAFNSRHNFIHGVYQLLSERFVKRIGFMPVLESATNNSWLGCTTLIVVSL